jgi:hypothetical protein
MYTLPTTVKSSINERLFYLKYNKDMKKNYYLNSPNIKTLLTIKETISQIKYLTQKTQNIKLTSMFF